MRSDADTAFAVQLPFRALGERLKSGVCTTIRRSGEGAVARRAPTECEEVARCRQFEPSTRIGSTRLNRLAGATRDGMQDLVGEVQEDASGEMLRDVRRVTVGVVSVIGPMGNGLPDRVGRG